MSLLELQPLLAEPVTIGVSTIAWIIVSIFATLKTVRHTEGAATPLWLALIWLVPCLGGILALLFVKAKGPKSS